MRIIDSFGLNAKLFLAEAVNFLIVIGIVYYIVSKKVFPKMEERITKIQEGVDNAEKSEEILEESKGKASEIIKESESIADQNIKDSVELAKKKQDELVKQAQEKHQEMLKDAEASANAEKDKIISSSKEEIAKMVVLGAEKVLVSK